MAQGKNSFTAYCDWIDSVEELTDEEAGKLFKHLLRYVNDLNPEAPDRMTKLLFAPFKTTLKRDLKKWETIRQRNVENGQKGGRPKKPIGLIENPNEPKKAVSVSVRDSVSVSVSKEKKNNIKKRFVKPSVDEVRLYCEERQNGIDPNQFINHYEANGWKRGKTPIKDWRACVRTWEGNKKEKSSGKKEKLRVTLDDFNNLST